MKKFILLLFLLYSFTIKAQQQETAYSYQIFFEEAYQLYPGVPEGLLEAVAYTNTHIRNINPLAEETSCAGLPGFYGVMGLVLDGKGYFRENMKTVAGLSGYNIQQISSDPRNNILAYAAACQNVLSQQKNKNELSQNISKVLIALSELNISSQTAVNDYTMNLYLYGIFFFLNEKDNQQKYGFPAYNFDMVSIFGVENIKIFTSKQINISGGNVSNENGQTYAPVYLSGPCPDYVQPNCTWVASPNHYTGWNGHTISAIAIHTVQGSYTSCVNWFQNTDANAATHYVVASNSAYAGQVTQMVNEDNAAWHVTSENWYAIGYEHEGWIDDPTWYTTTMYQTSAALTRDICTRQNINPLRTFFREILDDGTVLDDGLHSLGGETACVKIKGHQHFYGQSHTDPGPNWDWNYYYKLVNNTTPVTTYTAATGTFYDTGGSSGNYGNNKRKFWLIQPAGAQSITLTFTQFAVEADYDFMYIYNGTNEFAPLIGRYNTIAPVTINSTGGSLFIEFRSDCATTYTGWAASWTSTQTDIQNPATAIAPLSPWVNNDFTATFTDTDNIGGSGVDKKYYQVMDYNGTEWRSNKQKGFFNDNFNTAIHPDWTVNTAGGTWSVNSGRLYQSDSTLGNSNIYTQLVQNNSSEYMYQWSAKMDGNTSNRRCGLHFFVSNPTLPNRGVSYLAWFRADDDKVQIYRISGDTLYTKVDNALVINTGVWYDLKVIYNPVSGEIKVYMDDVPVASWTDPNPIQSGSYISLRNGNCKVQFDDVKVRKSRTASVLVGVGNSATEDARYQSPNATQEACRINTIVRDATENWSAQANANERVDWTAPTTAVSALPAWQTANFTATFTDADALSGIEKAYYQVLELNNGVWGSNPARGFVSDNFDVPDTNKWKNPPDQGTWNVTSGTLVQTDESVNNTNIYTPLTQNLSNRYMYQFTAKVEGTGTNRRFGFHFFCDSASLLNRGNSYFVWFRVELKTLEFYKVVNNSFSSMQKTITNITTNAGQWYDFKVIFDWTTGITDVFRNDTLLGSWTDAAPLTSGKYISFRSGNSKLSVDEIKVFRSRNTTATINVGAASTNDIRYENPDPSTYSAKIKSIVIDSASNLSLINYYNLNIDFSAPSNVTVADGPAADIDTTFIVNTLKANWTAASDANSGIAKYWYAIGSAPGATNICGWTDNGAGLSFTRAGLSLTDGQVYYVSVKSENGSGLQSTAAISDGQLYLISTAIAEAGESNNFTVSPNPLKSESVISFYLSANENISLILFDNSGKQMCVLANGVLSAGQNQFVLNSKKLSLSNGIYYLNFIGEHKSFVTKIIVL